MEETLTQLNQMKDDGHIDCKLHARWRIMMYHRVEEHPNSTPAGAVRIDAQAFCEMTRRKGSVGCWLG